MRKGNLIVAVVSIVLLMCSGLSCSGGSGSLEMVSVPQATDWEKQADIVMPEELVDEAEYCLSIENDEQWNFFQTATRDQRRAMVYVLAAYNIDMYSSDLVLFAPGHAEGNESNFSEIAEAMGGELQNFNGFDFSLYDSGLLKFSNVTSRQAAADLADKILKRYSDEVFYIEFNMPVGLD